MSADGPIHTLEPENLPWVDNVASKAFIGVASTKGGQRGKPPTILLVEDELFVRKAVAEVLESAGYMLVIAGSAVEALEACDRSSGPVDLLLADVVMPGMSGREMAAEFERRFPIAQILLMSGYPEQLALCEPSGSRRIYLAKPFSTSMLLQRVGETLRMKLSESEALP